jgi:two-component system response regulator YesN
MPRILIVDDEECALAAMVEYFADLGYEVDCALDEPAARDLLEHGSYAIVITDLRLSRGDRLEGLDLVERTRSLHPQTRCIVLTAFGSFENEERARRHGVAAFIHKPQPLREIARLVASLAGRARPVEVAR